MLVNWVEFCCRVDCKEAVIDSLDNHVIPFHTFCMFDALQPITAKVKWHARHEQKLTAC